MSLIEDGAVPVLAPRPINLHRHSLFRKFFKLFRLRSFAAWDAVTEP